MTFPEVLVRITEFGESVPHPKAIVLELRPEMMGDLSIRSEVRSEAQEPKVGSALQTMATANPDLSRADHTIVEILRHDNPAQATMPDQRTWPARLEDDFQMAADKSRLFAQRDLLVEMANITFRKYRNRLFGVNSASARPMEASVYATNLELLQQTLQYARQKGVRVVIYLGLCVRFSLIQILQLKFPRSVVTLDSLTLDTALPFWTIPTWYPKNIGPIRAVRLNQLTGDAGQHDFAHLRAPAHRLIAERLVQDFGTQSRQPQLGRSPSHEHSASGFFHNPYCFSLDNTKVLLKFELINDKSVAN